MTKAVPYGHACGQRAEEKILTCQNLIVAGVQEHAPVGAPSCVSTGEAAVQRRGLEEVLDFGSGMQEEDCPLGHRLTAVLSIPNTT